MLFHERRGPLQYAAALGGPHPAPDLERCACRADREIHVVFAAFCHLGNRLFGGWIQIDGIPAVDGCRRQAIDEQFTAIEINSAIHRLLRGGVRTLKWGDFSVESSEKIF